MSKEKTLEDKIIFIDNLIHSTFSKKTYLYYLNIIDEYIHQKEEIERLNSIIEEAIVYIKNNDRYSCISGINEWYGDSDKLIKILENK